MDEANDKKDDIIKFIYTDKAGFGSTANTLKAARKKDPSIARQDVKAWVEGNIDRKTDLKGYNSYIPPGPHYEYQIDLFFMSDLNLDRGKGGGQKGVHLTDFYPRRASLAIPRV